ncbi:MAG: class I SAM-dependent methyltransferase [Candidatus Hodarchaeota archaeon]
MKKENIPTVRLDYWSTFGQRLVDLMELNTGAKVLDVGTGSAACLIPAAKKIGSLGQIIGIDKYEKVIPIANENIQKAGLINASAQLMDAEEMKFKNHSFDYILSGFIGFSNVYDFKNHNYRKENKKMTEIFRVLKEGGKVGFSTWELQEDIETIRELVRKYLEHHSGNLEKTENIPPGYSKETTEGFKKLMLDAGFQNIQIATEKFSIVYRDEVEWWETMSQVASWVLKQTIGLEPEILQDFKEKMLKKELQSYKRESGYYFTKSVIFALGMK